MGTIVSKVKLKDGTVRDFADNYSRSAINIIEAAIGQIAPELEMTVHVVDDAADMPAPAASLEDKVYIYVGSTTQNYTQNTIYVCKETATAGTYAWSEIVASKDEVINIVNNIVEENKIQVTTMPAAASDLVGKVYQYIGITDANYTNGYFYKCVIDPNAEYTGAKLMAVFNDACGENYTNVAIFNDIISRWSQDKTLKCTFWLAFDPSSTNRTYKCALGPSITFNSSNNNIVFAGTWYRSDENITGSSQSTTWQTINNGGSQTVYNEDYVILDSFNTDYPGFESYKWERVDVQPVPEQYNDAKLRDKIGKLSDALGDDVLYTNYITDKTEIITTEKTMAGGNPIVSTTFDTLLKELKVTFDYITGVEPAFGSCMVLSGSDLFNVKLNKNLPNGTYTFQGDFIKSTSPLFFIIYGQNGSSSPVQITNTGQGNPSFTIDDTYEYNWVEVWIDTLDSSDPFRTSYKLVLTKDGESIKETMSRPKVPKYNASFVDHQYTFYGDGDTPMEDVPNGTFAVAETANQPGDIPSGIAPPVAFGVVKVKGWDDLVNSIDVKVRGTVDNSSINAGVTSTIATFEFYNGNESEEQDVTLEGVLNFSVTIVDYTNPSTILFSIYDNDILVGSYTIGIDTDGYKYINFKYVVSDNIGVGNKLYKIKMTPVNCDII